jgi:hypothetical protein
MSDWIKLSDDGVHLRGHMNTVVNIPVGIKGREYTRGLISLWLYKENNKLRA